MSTHVPAPSSPDRTLCTPTIPAISSQGIRNAVAFVSAMRCPFWNVHSVTLTGASSFPPSTRLCRWLPIPVRVMSSFCHLSVLPGTRGCWRSAHGCHRYFNWTARSGPALWADNNSSGGQEIPGILWKLIGHYRANKSRQFFSPEPNESSQRSSGLYSLRSSLT